MKNNFNEQHKKDFEAYFKEVQEREEAQWQWIGKAYEDTYKLYITNQEEDEDYIEGTKELLNNK